MSVENTNKNSDLTRIRIIDWLIDYIFLVGTLSGLLALIATFIIYSNPNNAFNRYFPDLVPYMKDWFIYGWSVALFMIAVVQLYRNYKLILTGFKIVSLTILSITRLNTKIDFSEFKVLNKLNKYSKKINLEQGEKALIKLTGDSKTEKSNYALKAPLDILPINKSKKKERNFSLSKYEAIVKTAFIRVGVMNEEQLHDVKVYEIKEGPRAIQINISLPNGMTVSNLKSKTEDLRHAFDAPSFQVEAGKAGRANLTIFLRDNIKTVLLRDVLERDDIQSFIKEAKLPMIVGLNPIGEPILFDLVKGPHLLVAGATLSGKTWWLIQVLYLLMMKLSPEELEIWIVDPKFVDFAKFKEVPHVKSVETEVSAAVASLERAVKLMDERYRMLEKSKCRNIEQYNAKHPDKKMKYIVITIDEIADLIIQNKESVLVSIARLAQKARAAGIHLINATQRPSVKIIDGDIKANLSSRISFRLKTQQDYTTIFGTGVDTELQGSGDGIADLEGLFGHKRFQSPGVGSNDTEIDLAITKLIKFWNGSTDEMNEIQQKNKKVNLYKQDTKKGILDKSSEVESIEKDEEIIFFHGKECDDKKVVPFSNCKAGTGIDNRKLNNENVNLEGFEYDDDIDEENINESVEGDIDSYHRLMILKKLKEELIAVQKNNSEEIVYAPSSNKLCSEIGIRKSTVLEHLSDLLKEGVVEKHPTNNRYMIKIDMDELENMIEDIDSALKFINSK